jgi:hypothetical protein
MPSVFVCSAPHDEPFAESLEETLRHRGLLTLPRSSSTHPERNFRAMELADTLLVVASRSWLAAEHAARELMLAAFLNRRSLSKPVVAIWLEEDLGLAANAPVLLWLSSLPGIRLQPEDDLADGIIRLVLVSMLPPGGDVHSDLVVRRQWRREAQTEKRDVYRAIRVHERADELAPSRQARGELEIWLAARREVDREMRLVDEMSRTLDSIEASVGPGERDLTLARATQPDPPEPPAESVQPGSPRSHGGPSGPGQWRLRRPPGVVGDSSVASPWLPPASSKLMAWATEQTAAPTGDIVDCSVFAPPTCEPGVWIFVQVYFHKPDQAADAAALAEEFDPGTARRGFSGLQLSIPQGCVLDVELDMKGARVEEPIQRLAWRGRAEAVQFDVQIAIHQAECPLRGSVVVRRDGIPIGRVGFRVIVAHKPLALLPSRQAEDPVHFSSAFISYASTDREEVLRRAQVLQAAGITFFQDLLSLDPGARWKQEIYRHIDESDLFLLFWSKAAKESKWVRREADRALRLQLANPRQLPEIRPVILGRPVVMPWKELKHLHFNDRLIYLLDH